jgi:hypothetical protein
VCSSPGESQLLNRGLNNEASGVEYELVYVYGLGYAVHLHLSIYERLWPTTCTHLIGLVVCWHNSVARICLRAVHLHFKN